MGVKFQYNRTALQSLEKQLKVRENALPTLKNKEAALRSEVKKVSQMISELEEIKSRLRIQFANVGQLWNEFDFKVLKIDKVLLGERRIAGVKIPIYEDVQFNILLSNLFGKPVWILDGIELLKQMLVLETKEDVCEKQKVLLDIARKKATQKVNLYEKVQIPDYQYAIRKVKRFLEDAENLSKSAQKIIKTKREKMKMGV